jgi:Domain of unknown function (DUF4288)
MPYYCARLLVVCLEDSPKPSKRNLYDYPFVVFRAANYSRAFKVALKLGKEQETRYKGSKGQSIRWAFVRVEEIKNLGQKLDGIEVGSILDMLRTKEALRFGKRFHPERSKPFFS